MEIWIGCFIGFLCVIICLLGIKIIVMRKSVQEITEAFAERLRMETNVLIYNIVGGITDHDAGCRKFDNVWIKGGDFCGDSLCGDHRR